MQRTTALGKTLMQKPDFSAETAYAYFLDSTASSHQTYQSELCPSANVISQSSLIYQPLLLVSSERFRKVVLVTLLQGKIRLLTTI